jgi:hypothetical protein
MNGAAQLLEAVEALGFQVVVLPNSGNVMLTAEQAGGRAPHRGDQSRSIPSGLAAMVARPAQDAVGNARADAGRHRRCATPSHACGPRLELDGLEVRSQAMGIVDGTLVAAADDVERVRRRSGSCARRRQYVTAYGINGSGTRELNRPPRSGRRGQFSRRRAAALPDPGECRMIAARTSSSYAPRRPRQ